MADKVIWYKLVVGMFDGTSFKRIKRAKIGGESFRDKLTAVWVELLDLAAKCNRNGFLVDEKDKAYEVEDIAVMLDREIDEVNICMSFYVENYMVEEINGTLALSNWEYYQAADGLEKIREQNRIRKQHQREREKLALNDVSRDSHATSHATVTHSSFETKELDKLVKEIIKKINNAGVYEESIHKPLIDEVINTIADACTMERAITLSGTEWTATDFEEILRDLTIEKVCKIVNAMLLHKDEIVNRHYYILGIVAAQLGGKR